MSNSSTGFTITCIRCDESMEAVLSSTHVTVKPEFDYGAEAQRQLKLTMTVVMENLDTHHCEGKSS